MRISLHLQNSTSLFDRNTCLRLKLSRFSAQHPETKKLSGLTGGNHSVKFEAPGTAKFSLVFECKWTSEGPRTSTDRFNPRRTLSCWSTYISEHPFESDAVVAPGVLGMFR